MKIIHHGPHADGGYTWSNNKNNGFISYSPKDAGTITDSYILARVGDGTFHCVCNNDFVYSFDGLLSGYSDAPVYMKKMARKARRFLDEMRDDQETRPCTHAELNN